MEGEGEGRDNGGMGSAQRRGGSKREIMGGREDRGKRERKRERGRGQNRDREGCQARRRKRACRHTETVTLQSARAVVSIRGVLITV